MQNGVAIVEQLFLDHENLGRPPLLGRTAEIANRPFQMSGGDLLGQCHCGRRRGDAKQMVSAGMPVGGFASRLAIRQRFLRHPWQRVEFANDADHRLFIAKSRGESRRDAGRLAFHLKAGVLEHLGQQGRRFCFLIARLCPVPDLECGFPRRRFAPANRLVEGRFLSEAGLSRHEDQHRGPEGKRPDVTTHGPTCLSQSGCPRSNLRQGTIPI